MDLGLMAIVFSESTLPVQTMSLNSDANTERRRRRFGDLYFNLHLLSLFITPPYLFDRSS